MEIKLLETTRTVVKVKYYQINIRDRLIVTLQLYTTIIVP